MIYKIKDIQRIAKPVFDKYGVRKAILFGSYAKGYATEDSDIDILVDSGCRGLKFFGLLEELTRALEKEIDLIEVYQVQKNSATEKEMYRTGKVIYGPVIQK